MFDDIVRDIVALFIEQASEEDIVHRHSWIVDAVGRRVPMTDYLTDEAYEEVMDEIELDIEDGIAEYYLTELTVSLEFFAVQQFHLAID